MLKCLMPCFYPKTWSEAHEVLCTSFEPVSVETSELYLSKICVYLEILKSYVKEVKEAKESRTLPIEYLQRNQRLFRSQGTKAKEREVEKLFTHSRDVFELKVKIQELICREPLETKEDVIRGIAEVTKAKMTEMEVNFLPKETALIKVVSIISTQALLFDASSHICNTFKDEGKALRAVDAFTLYLALLKDIVNNEEIFLNTVNDMLIVSFASFCGKVVDMQTALALNKLTNTNENTLLRALIERGDDIYSYYTSSSGSLIIQDEIRSKFANSVSIDDGDVATVLSDNHEPISHLLETNENSEKYSRIQKDSVRIVSSLHSESDFELSSQVSLPSIMVGPPNPKAKKNKDLKFSELEVKNRSGEMNKHGVPGLLLTNSFASLNDSSEIDRII